MFYTYLWLRADGTPYYVGKGHGNRAFYSCPHHRPPKDRGCILLQEFPSETDAFEAEKFLIAYYGRKQRGDGHLINRTDGGEGPVGMIHSVLTRSIMSLRKKGIPKTERTKQNMKAGQILRFSISTITDEHRRKLSEAAKRRIARDGGSHVRMAGKAGAAARWDKD